MIHMIGNAHIDPVWLWDWREGYQEVKATFRSALDRLNESADFVFTCACADYYRYVEEEAPEMFEEIRARVAEGRWVITGGMWIQPDCNLPAGESFARQLLYSQRYFMEKFGRIAVTGYNVDSFGHCATLPQLLRGAGIANYVFQRPSRCENADIPSPLFRWIAPDGSSVRTFRLPESYTCYHEVPAKIDRTRALVEETGLPVMCFYGVGNHGGGPTIENLREIDECRKTAPDVLYSSPDQYFAAVGDVPLPVWSRELQHHASGCYSAFSPVKRANRAVENALFQAEKFGVLARQITGRHPSPMTQAFHNLMFNQFHDVLCGCTIREGCEDALTQLSESAAIAAREQTSAMQRISWRIDTVQGLPRLRSKECHFMLWENGGQGTPVVVFNTNEFAAVGDVTVVGKVARVTDEAGHALPVQTVRASRTNNTDKWDSLFRADVPAFGWRLYWLFLEGDAAETTNPLKITAHSLENDLIRAEFDPETGALIHLIEKSTGADALCAPAVTRLIDIEHADTWAHGIFTFDRDVGVFGGAKFEIMETGPVRAALRVTSTFGASMLIQTYSLAADADQLAVETRLDLREHFRMVKWCFPTGQGEAVSAAETAYGVVEREMDGQEETCHRFVNLGRLAVLNDGKYSFSAQQGELRLTVANSSIFADHYGQNFRDSACRFMDMGEQTFRCVLIPHACDWRDAHLNRRAALLHQPLERVIETYHEGDLPPVYEGLSLSAENVAVGAVKRAEDGDGTILRLVETRGRAANVHVAAPAFARDFDAALSPWQIKTLFLPDDPAAPVEERLLTEYNLVDGEASSPATTTLSRFC